MGAFFALEVASAGSCRLRATRAVLVAAVDGAVVVRAQGLVVVEVGGVGAAGDLVDVRRQVAAAEDGAGVVVSIEDGAASASPRLGIAAVSASAFSFVARDGG